MATHHIDIPEATNTVETIDAKIREMDKSLDTIQLRVNHYVGQDWISEAATACKSAIDSQILSAKKYFTNIQVYLDDLRKKLERSSENEDTNKRELGGF